MKKIFRKIKSAIKYVWAHRPDALFSRCVVIFCIGYLVRIFEWAMGMFEDFQLEPSTTLTVASAAFGGELVLLCIKRITKKKNDDSDDEFAPPVSETSEQEFTGGEG